MYPETLYSKTKQVLDRLPKDGFLKEFYLAGGTALAIQLGYRKSIDLDFFTVSFPGTKVILEELKELSPKVTNDGNNSLDLNIEGVKVSFLEYKYPLLEKQIPFSDIQMASIIDIACMKITAISSRGNKKDFVDMYSILTKYTLEEVFKAFEEKYKDYNYSKTHMLRSLIYFLDAQKDPEPDYLNKLSWSTVKKTLKEKVDQYLLKD